MGISKLSDKCTKCDHKDICNEKRMEDCAYIIPTLPEFAQGGFPMQENLFMCIDYDTEMIGRLSNSKHHVNNEQLIDGIRRAVEQNINNCAFKVGD
jgi:hypothetical protein